ncbi:hypothetical protein [Pseudochelatococcus sp. G4_1912]|uniref:hypothetical protein n=1 Tax=Pseudochelatococcus sp. G4_1912 TaxID=3114288 RepID=UPI0039C71744
MTETRALKLISHKRLNREHAPRWQLTQALRWLTTTVLYTLALGLTLGALAHIITIFTIPLMGSNDAVNRLSEETLEALLSDTVVMDGKGFTPPWPDPAFVTTYCRFDLSSGPQRIRARTPDGFAGLSLHGPGGTVIYAVTDEVAQGGELALTILTADQAIDSPSDATDIRVIAPVQNGIGVTYGLAVYRVMASQPSQRDVARGVASTLRCGS